MNRLHFLEQFAVRAARDHIQTHCNRLAQAYHVVQMLVRGNHLGCSLARDHRIREIDDCLSLQRLRINLKQSEVILEFDYSGATGSEPPQVICHFLGGDRPYWVGRWHWHCPDRGRRG
mgnify:CR=1 FL=1